MWKLTISTIQKIFVLLFAKFFFKKIPLLEDEENDKIKFSGELKFNFEQEPDSDSGSDSDIKLEDFLIKEDEDMNRESPNIFGRGYVSRTTFNKFLEKNPVLYLQTTDRNEGFERVIQETAKNIKNLCVTDGPNLFKPYSDSNGMEGIEVSNRERHFIVVKPKEWKP